MPTQNERYCERCGREVILTHGFWFSVDDDFMCSDGEEEHIVSEEEGK